MAIDFWTSVFNKPLLANYSRWQVHLVFVFLRKLSWLTTYYRDFRSQLTHIRLASVKKNISAKTKPFTSFQIKFSTYKIESILKLFDRSFSLIWIEAIFMKIRKVKSFSITGWIFSTLAVHIWESLFLKLRWHTLSISWSV